MSRLQRRLERLAPKRVAPHVILFQDADDGWHLSGRAIGTDELAEIEKAAERGEIILVRMTPADPSN